MERKQLYFKVGDKVISRRDYKTEGEVLAYIIDGKLSKDFILVKWEDGIEELVPPEWLIKPDELQQQPFTKTALKKESDYYLEKVDEEDYWIDVALKLLKQGFAEEEVEKYIKFGTLYLVKDKFTNEPQNLILKLFDGRKIVFALKQPVKKHLDIDEVEKYLNKDDEEIDKKAFLSEVLPGEIKIKAVFDAYEIDFGDGNPLLIDKYQFDEFINEYNLDKEKILNDIEKQGFYKGKFDIFSF
jgi:uncharacterized protein YcgL (UPF0745 family)